MNIQIVKDLRDFLANLKPHQNFDHSTWSAEDDCGTSACICGWLAISNNDARLARYQSGLQEWVLKDGGEWFEYGMQKLALEPAQAAALFIPNEEIDEEIYAGSVEAFDLSTTRVEHAIAFLDRMIEHETVDIMWWADIKQDVMTKSEEAA